MGPFFSFLFGTFFSTAFAQTCCCRTLSQTRHPQLAMATRPSPPRKARCSGNMAARQIGSHKKLFCVDIRKERSFQCSKIIDRCGHHYAIKNACTSASRVSRMLWRLKQPFVNTDDTSKTDMNDHNIKSHGNVYSI